MKKEARGRGPRAAFNDMGTYGLTREHEETYEQAGEVEYFDREVEQSYTSQSLHRCAS